MINQKKLMYNRYKKFTLVAVVYLFISGVIYYIHNDIYNMILHLFIIITFVVNFLLKHSLDSKIFLFLLISSFSLIYFTYDMNFNHSNWLWSLTFPAFSFLLNNKERGMKWTYFYGVVLFILIINKILEATTLNHTHHELLVLFSVYVMISYLMNIFQQEVDLYNKNLEEVNNSLEKQIIKEVEENREKDNILSIQSKQAQMGEMVSMIAHQWRQPLNAISSSAILLQLENDMDRLTSEHITKTSTFIQDKTQDMSEIIDSFLEFSKPISDNDYFNIENIIQRVLKIINTQFELNLIEINMIYDENYHKRELKGSRNLLEQVLLNILINIKDAFDEHKELKKKFISIFVNSTGNITIKDNAGGIPDNIKDKVFNPYFTTKEEGKGTGLGLYMSRKIMKTNFQGDLLYEPIANGSCFKINFNESLYKGV